VSLAVPLLAYGAKFRVRVQTAIARIAAADYFTMPTLQNVMKENVLADDELLTHVILPAPQRQERHYEVRYKASHDCRSRLPRSLQLMNGSTIRSARVVLGAVARCRGGRARPKSARGKPSTRRRRRGAKRRSGKRSR